MATKLCDTCKSATAALFCRPDSAFLCLNCDSRIHVASRHARVWLCEVCEHAPAQVTCKADAAALCVTCDRDIHSANPVSRRHERVPVTPLYDSVKHTSSAGAFNFLDDCCFSELDGDGGTEEEEAASWLLPTAMAETTGDSLDMNRGQYYLLSGSDPYVDLDCGLVDPKMEAEEQDSSASDGVVPVESSGGGFHIPMVNENCFHLDFSSAKAYPYDFNCINQSVSSSSLEVGVVPDSVSTAADRPSQYGGGEAAGSQQPAAVPLSSAEREARVMRYREKRKNRKFEKTIRYASRKAYAEMRPRIKGRFAKRSDVTVDADRNRHRECDLSGFYSGFGVVPTF